MESLTLFDIASVGFILFLGIKGILRGFIKEFFGLIGIIGGIYIGSRYASKVGEYIDINFLNLDNKSALYLIGFIVVFILFWLIASLLGSLFSNIANMNGAGIIDKILGFIVGGAKIFFIISIMIYILSSINLIKDRTTSLFKDSVIYPIYLEYGEKIVKLDKDQKIQNKIKEKIEILDANLSQ